MELKSIYDLLDYQFKIPYYQRGYRWEKDQVIALLNDVWEFHQAGTGQFYCLQPIIVKQNYDNSYTIIDGQQRLTTIYLILRFLDENIRIFYRENRKFGISYETRPDLNSFFDQLNDNIEEPNTENVDHYYMSQAYIAIRNWFNTHNTRTIKFIEALRGHESNANGDDISRNVRIIWQEINENQENEINVFSRINSGKIRLTNAELIKALFLNRSNFNEQNITHRQIEIAKEWDEMEYSLQNDSFYKFLVPDKNSPTRIELIFKLISNTDDTDEFATYRYFSELPNITQLWAESENNVKKTFYGLRYLFENNTLYHVIGFIISAKIRSLQQIYQIWTENNRDIFKMRIIGIIRNEISPQELEDLTYDEDKDKRKIKIALLLHNIATIENNAESNVRFAFDKFNAQKWSLEHIHAQSDQEIKGVQNKKDWLRTALPFLEPKSDLLNDIQNILVQANIDENEFREIQSRVVSNFGSGFDDSIKNLALLSSSVNSALGNNIFPVKRKILINKDMHGEFIPICTKNIFLKYYSDINVNHFLWNNDDKENYLDSIVTNLENFIQNANI